MSDTATVAPATTSFADFGVEPALCEALADVGITSPFPIQELTLPLALSGADIIGQARTGTGKTLGFGLPLLQRIDTAKGLQALVIVPTRELCLQVSEDLAQAGRIKGVKVVALYGGKAMQPQIDALAGGAQLVVGTPGRLLDLSRRGFLDLSGAKALVLDEADEMLDLGFLPDVEQLVEQCSDQRQTLLFSATMPSAIVSLARRYMTKPTFMRADVEEVHIAPKTEQHFFSCHRMDKPAVLARILQTPDRGLCVVFCRTKRMADILAEELRDRDVPAQAIHSDLRQEARERALQRFRDGTTTVLCATEVAARGLDIDDVSHVVNYDCPDDEKMYLHRIGRTGRAGNAGVAITFAVYNEIPRLEMIRRALDIDVEIHEVFSTSPLLDELFDLPPREERSTPKVASPPQTRTGKPSRSGRREESSEEESDGRGGKGRGSRGRGKRDDEGSDPRRSKSDRGEPSRGGRKASDDDSKPTSGSRRTEKSDTSEDTGGDGETITRRRRRRRTTGDADDSGRSGSTTASPAAASDEDDDTEDRTITRRRRRRGGRDDERSDDTTPDASADDRSKASDATADAPADADSDDDGAPVATRTRARATRSRSRTSRTSESGGGQDPADDDSSDRASRSGGRSRNGDAKGGGRDGGARNGGGGNGGSDNGKGGRGGSRGRGKRGSDRDSRGGRDDAGGRGRGGSSRGRSDGDRSPRRSTVDAGEARGDGKPRLSRKLEVVHLP